MWGAMHVRERYLRPANAEPDNTAKIETMHFASQGKEHPAVIAYRNGRLGFGFSAGGLLFPYFVGVVSSLASAGIVTPSVTPLAGASAGSLIAGCFHAGLSKDKIMAACLELAFDLRKQGSYRRMGPCLQRVLEHHLPDDVHERCSGSTHIAITHMLPYARSHLVSEFTSKADVIQALLTSCHIPFYFAGTFARTFRGRYCYDGGVTNFIPVPPDLDYAARVCCFPSKGISMAKSIHIAPDCFDDSWADLSLSQLLQWALAPASDAILQEMMDKGAQDAAMWAQLTGVADAACSAPDDWYHESFLIEAAQAAPSIRRVRQKASEDAEAVANDST